MSYIKIKVLNLTPQIGGSKRRSKSKKRKSKKSKKRKSKKLNLTPQQLNNVIKYSGLSLGMIDAIMDQDSYMSTMMRAKKEGRSSFEFRGRMFYGTPHPRLGMIYKEKK